jgi:protein TonB
MSSLAEFTRGHQSAPVPASSRLTAGLLTVSLYALLLFLAEHRTFWNALQHPPPSEIDLKLVLVEHVIVAPAPPPDLAHQIRPHVESAAPPEFTIAPVPAPAPALLTASAAPTSPLPAGTAGTGTQSASASGRMGNGAAPAGCWDKAWAQTVSDRVEHFYYYPRNRTPHGQMTRPMRGVAMVHLSVRRDGKLDSVRIEKSSGYDALDFAATDMVRKADPLPPIPDRMHVDRAEGVLPIAFGMSDSAFKPSDTTCIE